MDLEETNSSNPKSGSLSYWTTALLGQFLCDSTLNLLWHLSKSILLISRNIFPVFGCSWDGLNDYPWWKLQFFFLRVAICKRQNHQQSWKLNYLLFSTTVGKNRMVKFSKIQLRVNSISTSNALFCRSISFLYSFSLAGNIIVYKPSQGTKREVFSSFKH